MSIHHGMQRLILTGIFFLITIGITYSQVNNPDIVVAQDGSGKFKKVQEAVNAAKSGQTIFVKAGIYKEQVKVSTANIKIIGESYETTIITFNLYPNSDGKASMIISGGDFYAEQITIQNTIDSRVEGGQAEALRISGDKAVFYMCKITGFQDTYRHMNGKRSYHKNCIIEGTTDFIYGDGIALFEDCLINNRKDSHVTAHAPGAKRDYGYVFKNCEIKKHPDEIVTNASLGRPWGNNANVVYLNCYVGEHIRSDGWMVWNGKDTYESAYYAEYKSYGPGAKPDKRLSWTHQLTDSDTARYANEKVLGGWNPVIKGAAVAVTFERPAITLQEHFYTLSNNSLHILQASTSELDMKIFTLDGKIVLARKLKSVNGLIDAIIPLGNVKSGSYLIQLKVGSSGKTGYISLTHVPVVYATGTTHH